MIKTEKKLVWFGMKLSPDEKLKIKSLAHFKGISQKEVVMELIDKSYSETLSKPGSGQLKDRLRKYRGVVDNTVSDLSTNKDRFRDYGKNSLS